MFIRGRDGEKTEKDKSEREGEGKIGFLIWELFLRGDVKSGIRKDKKWDKIIKKWMIEIWIPKFAPEKSKKVNG